MPDTFLISSGIPDNGASPAARKHSSSDAHFLRWLRRPRNQHSLQPERERARVEINYAIEERN